MSTSIVTKVIEKIENEQIVVETEAKEVISEIVSQADKRKMYEEGNDESIDTFVRNVYFDFEFILMNKPYGKEKELNANDVYELAKQYGFDMGRNDIEIREVITDKTQEYENDKVEEQVKDDEILEEPAFDIDKEIEMMFKEAGVEDEQEVGTERNQELEVKEAPKVEVKEEPKVEVKEETKVEVKEEPEAEIKEAPKVEVKEEPKVEVKEELKAEIKETPKAEVKEEPKVEVKEETGDELDLEDMLNGYTKVAKTKASSSEKVLINDDKKNHNTVDTVQTAAKEKLVDMSVKQADTAQTVKQIAKHTERLFYYRLIILSFKGNLSTLDKDLAKINKNLAYKSALIENAKKNCVQVYSENVSLSKIKEEKKMLDEVGFVTELQELSVKSNAVIDLLHEKGMLIKGFSGCEKTPVSMIYQFEEMNQINSIVGNENIKHIEYMEIYETPLKKVKYNKSGMVKIPFLGAGPAYLIFTDTKIIISGYSGLQIIDKADVEELSSAFEKKTFSSSYGQIQVTMKNGIMLILGLRRNDYSVEARNEFDTRVPILKAAIK